MEIQPKWPGMPGPVAQWPWSNGPALPTHEDPGPAQMPTAPSSWNQGDPAVCHPVTQCHHVPSVCHAYKILQVNQVTSSQADSIFLSNSNVSQKMPKSAKLMFYGTYFQSQTQCHNHRNHEIFPIRSAYFG